MDLPSIAVLPNHVIDQIAAGEVVERPASVVKELVENSLDAKARRIWIELEQGGRGLIRVSDDGVGMSAEQLTLALTRHATSKLRKMEDLISLRSMGFRGEALPSIASVSRMTMASRPKNSDMGHQIFVEGGRVAEQTAIGAAQGTSITVRDLLWNVPARLKFLKTDATEFSQIRDLVERFALVHYSVHLGLVHNGKLAVEFPPHANPLERVRAVLGSQPTSKIVESHFSNGESRGVAFLAPPEWHHSTARNVQLFINERWVRDRGLLQSVLLGYGESLAKGRYPLAIIHLQIPGTEVDVNVHPQKTEVRFADAQRVFGFVRQLVRKAISEASWTDANAPLVSEKPRATSVAYDFARHQASLPLAMGTMPNVLPGIASGLKGEFTRPEVSKLQRGEGSAPAVANKRIAIEVEPTEEISQVAIPGTQTISSDALGSVRMVGEFSAYWLVEEKNDLLVVDWRAALSEKLYQMLRDGTGLEEPLPMQATHQTCVVSNRTADLFLTRYAATLALGFEMQEFGEHGRARVLAVKRVPQLLAKHYHAESHANCLEILLAEQVGNASEEEWAELLWRSAAQSVAKRHAKMEDDAMHEMLSWVFADASLRKKGNGSWVARFSHHEIAKRLEQGGVMPEERPRLVVVVGPTASGKSETALRLALACGGEILSLDSQQIFRGMDIGTGKLSPSERRGVAHHLLDILHPDEEISVADFVKRADEIIADAHARNVPIVVAGGTMLYERVLLYGLFEGPGQDAGLRQTLANEAEANGVAKLWHRLATLDPKAAAKILPQDKRRIIRALEVLTLTGRPMSQWQAEHDFAKLPPRYDTRLIGLCPEDQELTERIYARVDSMIALGWLEEVKKLRKNGYLPPMRSQLAIGYGELHRHLDGTIDKVQAVGEIKRNTRRYARRQKSWYKNDPRVEWYATPDLVPLSQLCEFLGG